MSKLLTLLLFATTILRAQEKPIWAKAAMPLAECGSGMSKGKRFKSPDGTVVAELRCHSAIRGGDPRPYLVITMAHGRSQEFDLQSAASSDYRRPQELLWSPDSKAFFINGSESAYSGLFVDVYRVDGDRVRNVNATSRAQHDMVAGFPPCRAKGLTQTDCQRIEHNPAFNMSGLAWIGGSSALVVMAEVPCSSMYGGIMCQVRGYELSATDGRIIKRLSAAELKQQWQNDMAFEMRIPEPPEYKAHPKKSHHSGIGGDISGYHA
jgi:hypothetical protein